MRALYTLNYPMDSASRGRNNTIPAKMVSFKTAFFTAIIYGLLRVILLHYKHPGSGSCRKSGKPAAADKGYNFFRYYTFVLRRKFDVINNREFNTMRCRLHLKDYEYTDPEGLRIFELTRKNIESFNGYVDDFHESIGIIREKMEKGNVDRQKKMQMFRDIEYIENKIQELSMAMKAMADDMPFLIELRVVKTD